MKKLFYLLIALCLVSCGKSPEIKVMTFNIRMDTPVDGKNSWEYRKENVAQLIKETDVDILGMQEVLVHQLNDLKTSLPQYNAIGVGRFDGKEAGEYSPLFYKKDRFIEISSGWFWLSENPEAVGVKGWDAACERIATWAVLEEKGSKKKLFVLSTHFDHIGQVARRESAELILRKVNELGRGLPQLVMGDFNAEPESEVVTILTNSPQYKLSDSKSIAQSVLGPNWTFHDYGRMPENEREMIDYIFVNDTFNINEYQVLPEKNENGYYSDHAAVFIHISFK